MRARAGNGYWVFQAPIGYRYARVGGHGKMLVRDEPLASIIAEALEGYATGRFDTQVEVKRFLEGFAEFPKDRRGEIRSQQVTDLLTRVLYAGYIDLPDWGIRLLPAKHEPLISFATFQAIRDRLNGTAKAPARKDLSEDFPLRGFVTCGCCGTPMTACWSKGRSTTYPYYLCPKRGCEAYGKSIRRETLEGDFESLLAELQPSEGLFNMACAMFRELWDSRLASSRTQARSSQDEVRQIERQVEQLLDRIIATDNAALITTYEKRITALEEQKALLRENAQNRGRPLESFDRTLRTALDFLANPRKLRPSERLEDKRTVLKLVFATRLPYVRNEGFRTAVLSLPFKVLGGIQGGECGMARPAGFEPTTPGLGILCSILLSYGRVFIFKKVIRKSKALSLRKHCWGNIRGNSLQRFQTVLSNDETRAHHGARIAQLWDVRK